MQQCSRAADRIRFGDHEAEDLGKSDFRMEQAQRLEHRPDNRRMRQSPESDDTRGHHAMCTGQIAWIGHLQPQRGNGAAEDGKGHHHLFQSFMR